MKKRHKNEEHSIITLRSPYRKSDDEDLNICYERYKEDPDNCIETDGLVYHKALEVTLFNIAGRRGLVAAIDIPKKKIGDRLIDDNGNIFDVKGFPMIRFKDGMSEWYIKMGLVVLSGNHENIGEYFALMN